MAVIAVDSDRRLADRARPRRRGDEPALNALSGLIQSEIAAHGPITVARYMELALGHSEHGYYRTRDPLGADGDFITAPEVSQMFGELIGLWAAVTWEQMGKPESFVLAELGPGRGTLMADALRAAQAQEGFTAAATLHLIETSPALRARQQEVLGHAAPQWHDDITTLPDGPLIVFANEFFDALPVRQFIYNDGAWHERLIVLTDKGADKDFCFTLAEDGADDPALPATAPDGTVMEICRAGETLATTLGARFSAKGGAALIIDYGYGQPASGDTLQAVKRHAYTDPLADPGNADITTHINFTALADAARNAGAATFGPLGQGMLLLALGIAQRAEILSAPQDATGRGKIEVALRRLIAPSEMGTLFKVLALSDPRLGTPPGFA
jgi:NADH dehydrogenase [ubiquinone] 1 alpha subcomplex assembly factor 7